MLRLPRRKILSVNFYRRRSQSLQRLQGLITDKSRTLTIRNELKEPAYY